MRVAVMTPFEIRILLHYFTMPESEPEQAAAPIFKDTCEELVRQELLQPLGPHALRTSTHYITERGEAYCRFLQEMPLPVQKWVMPT